ncbi:hypothetical protein K8P10_001375 [Leucobacter sp. Psy1]|uniref:DUF1156 domain-containing protein n=1 Tax=Leucobacter sp. Psy1 TaxID=2875729 RepID=UPI001CD21B75|nr:DUF1156 domain-containing protein [Leucobacter sp. Psy1]UBH05864.1 hypothetical protein K8P10_001375 [Leucobacter sp. Psy1]
MAKKKLIEVALPLDAINAQSAREKSIRHGHPSTLHLWWSRKPLATARAVLFAQLVDDPSAREDEYRAEAQQRGERDIERYVEQRVEAERERLFDLITRMVNWDNLGNERLLGEARDEILRSTGGAPPAILDPFAGGGSIPLEAQRLGLQVHASDLNPVAVLINKALVEIPPKFSGQSPVFPFAAAESNSWPKSTGLAEDVKNYGNWVQQEAKRRVGHLYPKATLEDGSEAEVIAWIWARTIPCPNPACGIKMPLVTSWWISKKKGREVFVVPTVREGGVEYSIGTDSRLGPPKADDGTVSGRRGAKCISCGAHAGIDYIREQGELQAMGADLMAVVAGGNRRRLYLPPTAAHQEAANVSRPSDAPSGAMADNPRWFSPPAYGMKQFADVFTLRQLTTLTVFSDLVGEARERIFNDAMESDSLKLIADSSESSARAYADAVATYLGLWIGRIANRSSSLSVWNRPAEKIEQLFARHAIPMLWEFPEANLFSQSTGNALGQLGYLVDAIAAVPGGEPATVTQADAASMDYSNALISTDPPYYDSIGYSDLSDFFYVWFRRSMRDFHPSLLSTLLVPKAEELVANPYRHGGKVEAKDFFETGFEQVFQRARKVALDDFPITVYYAFKQSEVDKVGKSSVGWETILSSMIRAGWQITATWPVRSERAGRMNGNGVNALASSIVLALRPRPKNAQAIERRSFSAELRSTLPEALRALQQGSVAPVDLAQAAIGPGMAVYSKYSEVIESDGSSMPVREALRQINAVLDEVVSEQEGEFDADTRWCIAWYESHGFDEALYGEAETLANAKNASIDGLRRSGVLRSGGGKVALLAPGELPEGYDPAKDDRISLWEVVLHLARALDDERGGLDAAGRILQRAEARGIDGAAAHQLSYLLHQISEKKGRTAAQILFNDVAASWPEIRAAARAAEKEAAPAAVSTQLDFDLLEEV